MPMHDWTRVAAGTYHDFHCSWLTEIKNRLNRGVLPADHYAQVEQVAAGFIADILALRVQEPEAAYATANQQIAIAVSPPPVSVVDSLDEQGQYTTLARRVAIHHNSDDRIVAVIELVSPGNKATEYALRTFVEKALSLLYKQIHLLVIDPFPPTSRDPTGIHGAIWGSFGRRYDPPMDKPLTMVAYDAGLRKTAYVEPFAVGDKLTSMPLLLTSEHYVPVPLEESYITTWAGVPHRWQQVLEG